MIELKKICFSYGEKEVLKNFSLEITGEEPVLLYAKSGRGKTTLLHIICGILKPTSGELEAPKSIGTVFQENRLIEHISCRQNCMIASGSHGKIEKLFKELDIFECLDKLPKSISGGQRRRVAIARALVFDCDAYVLDEPFAGLDSASKEKAIHCIKAETQGKPLIFVSHNADDASEMQAKIIKL